MLDVFFNVDAGSSKLGKFLDVLGESQMHPKVYTIYIKVHKYIHIYYIYTYKCIKVPMWYIWRNAFSKTVCSDLPSSSNKISVSEAPAPLLHQWSCAVEFVIVLLRPLQNSLKGCPLGHLFWALRIRDDQRIFQESEVFGHTVYNVDVFTTPTDPQEFAPWKNMSIMWLEKQERTGTKPMVIPICLQQLGVDTRPTHVPLLVMYKATRRNPENTENVDPSVLEQFNVIEIINLQLADGLYMI